jgi:hypothetical protein
MDKVSCDCSRQSQEAMRRTYQAGQKSRGRGCITSPDESLSDDVFQLICGECEGGSRVCRSNNSSGYLIGITMSNSSSASIVAITSLNSVAMLLAILAKFVGFPI